MAEQVWTIRVCKHGEVVTFGEDGRPRHVWEPGGGSCDDTAMTVAWVEVVPRQELQEAVKLIKRLRSDMQRRMRGDESVDVVPFDEDLAEGIRAAEAFLLPRRRVSRA